MQIVNMTKEEKEIKYENALRPGQKFYVFWKNIIGFFGAFVGISIFALPMLVIAIIIKCTSKGPIFFRQERVGKNKKVFTLIKFRSMRADAPEIPPSEMTPEQQKAMEYKFGNFLRKTSLDELPQLFNIFIGQMAFIGPRPGAAHNEEELIALREKYHPTAYLVKPGLSGHAQIAMRRDHDPEKKAYHDAYYVKHLSLWFDIKVFVKSCLCAVGLYKGR